MKCARCDSPARLAILNADGSYFENNAFCCQCFVKDMQKELKKQISANAEKPRILEN